jgi:phosphoribosylaminoimidazole carboxylase PurE protein
MSQARVAIVIGSDSDWPTMEACYKQLGELGIPCEVQIMSAHRTPEKVHEYARTAQENGVQVLIAAAGLAAALAGTFAALTTLPVIGVPLDAGPLRGVDALLSTVQMPPGVPVATVGIGQMGARNAAVLAAQILALNNPTLDAALKNLKRNQADMVDNKNQILRERLSRG